MNESYKPAWSFGGNVARVKWLSREFSDYQSVRLYFVLTAMAAPIKSFNNGIQISPGLNADEIQIPHDKHCKVSSLVKSHQNTLNYVKYEIINNYSPKWRWLVVDIYRAAKRRGKCPTLATDTEVNSCFSIY